MASRRERFRTKLCRNFALGHCPQGDQCKYLHPNIPSIAPNYSITHPSWAQLNAAMSQFMHPMPQFLPSNQWLAAPNPMQSLPLHRYPPVNSASSFPNPGPAQPGASPQYKPLSWRTALCRHFTKNRGWCPLGDECNYIHDLQLADIALEDMRFPAHSITASSIGEEGRRKAGSKHSHCWAYVQGLCHVQDCPYLHPVAVHLFVRHTPCLAWPNCNKGALCPYKHPEPIIPKVPALPLSLESTPSMQPPSPVENTLSGAVQFHGTTYFPLHSQAPVSPVASSAQQQPPQPYGQGSSYETVPMEYMQAFGSPPWQFQLSPLSMQAPVTPGQHYDMQMPPPHNSASSAFDYRQTARSPAWKDRVIYEAEPLSIHAPFSEQLPRLAPRDPSVPRSSAAYQAVVDRISKLPATAEEEEFPYVPPKIQHVGHARRISVTLKSKEDSDALGLFSEGSSRESWKTHGNRQTHKSWAPSTSSMTFM